MALVSQSLYADRPVTPAPYGSADVITRTDGLVYVYTEVTVVWDQLFLGAAQGPFTANPGRHAATYYRRTNSTQDVSVGTVAGLDGKPRPADNPITPTTAQATPLSAGPKFPRRYVTSDSEPMTPEQGARRATWLAERMEFEVAGAIRDQLRALGLPALDALRQHLMRERRWPTPPPSR